MSDPSPSSGHPTPLVLWDERALIDWDAGMRACVYAWLGAEQLAPAPEEIGEALDRAEQGARASGPSSFIELMRRIYVALSQDFAFTPRPLDLIDLEQRLGDFFPRPRIATQLRAISRAGYRLAWLGEAHAQVASVWRARIGIPFDTMIELVPHEPFLGAVSLQSLDIALGARASGAIVVQHPQRPRHPSLGSLAGVLQWPDKDFVAAQGSEDEAKLAQAWTQRLSALSGFKPQEQLL